MMRIVLDARKIDDYGIGTYIRGLLGALADDPSGISVHLLLPPGCEPVRMAPSWTTETAAHRPYGLSEFTSLGRVIGRAAADLFHSPHYTVPAIVRHPTVVTIHDLIHLRFPETFSGFHRLYARWMIAHANRVAGAILTPSESTKRDLMERFGISERRIVVTPLGVGAEFRPYEPNVVERFRERHALPAQYCLFLGNPKPHKGISILLQAFRSINRQNNELPLVIAGGTEVDRRMISEQARALGVGQHIRFIGGLDRTEIPLLVNGASILAVPSLWEGFGLPVVEAMACGTPVVCTTAGSLPEVAGDAAWLVRPNDPEALADGIQAVAFDSIRRADLRQRGLDRSKRYRWDLTAKKTLEVYRSVLP